MKSLWRSVLFLLVLVPIASIAIFGCGGGESSSGGSETIESQEAPDEAGEEEDEPDEEGLTREDDA